MKLFPLASVGLLVAACSSSSSGSSPAGPGSSALAPFAAYCTGTLSVDKPLLVAAGSGAWMSDGSHASAGSTFLVAYDFGGWNGYVIRDDGTPAQIDVDAGGNIVGSGAASLIPGTDFNSACATGASPQTHNVLLAKADLHSKQDLSDAACTLDAGTELTQFEFVNTGGAASVGATEIQSKCGYSPGYSNDIHYAPLIAK